MTETTSLQLHREVVRPEWVDYNNHMNVAYYVLIFDHATDAALDALDLGTAYRERTSGSVFVVEAHVTYEDEVLEGEAVTVDTTLTGFDGKRVVLFHQMIRERDGVLAATNEVLCLHVDLVTRRTAPLPDDAADRIRDLAAEHAKLPRPPQAGRAIGLRSRRPAASADVSGSDGPQQN